MKKYKPSLMKPGDAHKYRHATTDKFETVNLAEIDIPAEQAHVQRNEALIALSPNLEKLTNKVWIPRIIDPKEGDSKVVQFTKTGGRTTVFDELPIEPIILNLKDFGWSKTDIYQEFVPEIKGSGTRIRDAGLTLKSIEHLAQKKEKTKLLKLVHELEAQPTNPLAISSKNDRDRPKGSQIEHYEHHALKVSKMLQTNFPVKFTPELYVTMLPQEVKKQINFINKAIHLNEGEKMCPHNIDEYAQGIRLTPSTVRAIYLDKASNDSQLAEVVSRISKDPQVLKDTSAAMLKDTKRYLEAIANTTKQSSSGYIWAKVGDIHLAWQKDANPRVWNEEEVNYYKTGHDFAWYLAKDMTVAAGTGYWFVDLESLRAGPRYQLSKSYTGVSAKEDLFRKHELYVICAMRDLGRVTTQFEIGRKLLKGKEVPYSKRNEIEEQVLTNMISEANKSNNIELRKQDGKLKVQIYYPKAGFELSKEIPLQQLSPIY